jgi:hypothetical protein
MPKSIKLSCDIKGTVQVEYPKLFEGETVNIHVEYPSGSEAWLKHIDFVIGTDKENVAQPALTLDYMVTVKRGTLDIQPYCTNEWLVLKFDTVSIPINASIRPN